MTHTKPEAAVTDVDALAQEIRRVNGSNNLGAGAMAEALMPFVQALRSNNTAGVEAEPVAWLKTWTTGSDHCKRVDLGPHVEPWLAECSPTITPLYASPTPIVEPVAPEAVAEPFGWWVSDNASEAYMTFERDEHTRRTRMAMRYGDWTETPLYATPTSPKPAPVPEGVTDEMIERGLAQYSEGGCMGLDQRERKEVVEAILTAALTMETRT